MHPASPAPERLASAQLRTLAQRAQALVQDGRRRLLGITGPPGSGKSTLAGLLATALLPAAAVAPMDGFHLANAELERLGRRDRKGAPDTFDVAGYVALLARLRSPGPSPVYAPAFDRAVEEPVAGSLCIEAAVPLVVTEGNYLLLPDGDWPAVRALLDEVWYVQLDDAVRLERLVRRHEAAGKDPAAARAWAGGSDARNAERVAATRDRADLVVTLSPEIGAR